MKSVFLSFLMFIIVFTALKLDILHVLDNSFMIYIALVGLLIVVACGLYFVGIPKLSDIKKQINKTQEKKDD